MNVRRLLIAAVVVMQSVIAHAQWINQTLAEHAAAP